MAALRVKRTGLVLRPDSSRVFFRLFELPSALRVTHVLARIMAMSERDVEREATRVLRDFTDRHQKMKDFLLQRFEQLRSQLMSDMAMTEDRKLLIGAYFTQEYSLEAAALFNPSIVPHPDQSGLADGELKLVLSLRATGEGHLSSIVFRTVIVDREGKISVNTPTRYVTAAQAQPSSSYNKQLFERKLFELGLLDDFATAQLAQLGDTFTFQDLERGLNRSTRRIRVSAREEQQHTARGMLVLALCNYEIRFNPDSRLSERVIFPNTPYSAYDGQIVVPQILETKDFLDFRISTLNGPEVRNKGMALFPRKINGYYAMISRQDGENIFLMYSEMSHFWYEKKILMRPTEPWEFVQLGNCGSPIETEEGWLLLTHGVGPMRRYFIGAVLLDLEDPSKVIGRLPEPLLAPTEREREGYVPNVVYSCGALVHAGLLVIPYAMSDQCTSFATVPMSDLLRELKRNPPASL